MLVLAMEFSRDSCRVTEDPAQRRRRRGHGTQHRGIHSLKTEQKSPTPSTFGLEEQVLRQASSVVSRIVRTSTGNLPTDNGRQRLLRKEVIQPHLPVRLPCYDFTPIADPTFDSSLLAVGPLASGVANFRGVTGGVYKARERIHPGSADPGLLATPTSRSRVADSDPN